MRRKWTIIKVWIALVLFGTAIIVAGGLIVRNRRLDTMLVRAVKDSDSLAVNRLLKEGANPNACDVEGSDQLWVQIIARVTRKWVNSGPPVLALVILRSNEKQPARQWPRQIGLDEPEPISIVQSLLCHGADANAKLLTGESIAAYAQDCGYRRCVRTLIEHGANPNVQGAGGMTLLQNTIYDDDVLTVRALLQHGARVCAINPNCIAPLKFALSTPSAHYAERRSIISLLRNYGAR